MASAGVVSVQGRAHQGAGKHRAMWTFWQPSTMGADYDLRLVGGPTRRPGRPAYSFLRHSQQPLFQFQYRLDELEAGDDRQLAGGRLPT